MNRSVYIATTDSYSGKSLISLGILQMIMRKTPNVGYFRPVIDDYPKGKKDNHIMTMIAHFKLNMQYEEAFAFTRNEVIEYKNDNRLNDIFDSIIEKYKALEERFDFVLIEGTDFFDEGTSFEFNLNSSIAQSLNVPALLIVKDDAESDEELINHVKIELNSFIEKDIKVIAAFINRCDRNAKKILPQLAKKINSNILFSIIPNSNILGKPTLQEIADKLGAHILYGHDKMNIIPQKNIVGGMQLSNFLNHIKEDSLTVLPGDRSDLLVGILQAHASKNYPRVAGIILSGGLLPPKSIVNLLDGSQNLVPIMTVNKGTFQTTSDVDKIKSKIYPESTEKIKLSINLFEKHVDLDTLDDKIASFQVEGVTSRMFQYNMVKAAKKAQKHIVLPEGEDDRILTAASQLAKDGVVYLTILGKDPEKIKSRMAYLGLYWDSKRINIVNPAKSPHYKRYAQTLYELRKHKGMELAQAKDLMLDLSYFGTMMVYLKDADGMVSGAMHTTAHTIRPALQFVKTKPGLKTVSSVFFMLLDDRVLVYGDCAIVPSPTAEQLAEIAISSANTAQAFGIMPKVAMLSYSSGVSGTGKEVEKVALATQMVKEQRPDLLIEGPIQYDAAVDPSVGNKKMPGSLVAGQANVLIFPDLNTGNNTYKAVQRESGGLAIGPVLQGLNKPVNDLSRGAKIDDIYNTVVITAIQAEKENNASSD
ncbi:MAG: phosphate acetyltransferase [Flavobacteriales bacterium]